MQDQSEPPIHALFVDPETSYAERAVDRLPDADGAITVTGVTSREAALEAVAEDGVDCIVAATTVDGEDGLDLLRTVREDHGGIPYILSAERPTADLVTRALTAGVNDVIRRTDEEAHWPLLAHDIRTAVTHRRAQNAEHHRHQDRPVSHEPSTDAFVSLDAEWRVTAVDEYAEALLDRDAGDLLGTVLFETVPELQDADLEDTLRTAAAENQRHTVEIALSRADTSVQVTAFPDGDGVTVLLRPLEDLRRYEQVVTALHAVAHDLTGMDSVDQICRRTIEAAENLLEFDFSVVALEKDGFLRPRAVSSEMPLSEYDAMSIHEGVAGRTYRTGEPMLVEDTRTVEEVQADTPWGSAISLPVGEHGNFQAVDEEPGAFDETDLQLAELLVSHTAHHLDRLATKQTLERKNERLSEFASIVSHDLRNPLNVASGRLELASGECDSEHLVNVERALARMDDLIEDLLTLARQGEAISETEPVTLSERLGECWSTVDVGDAQLAVETTATIRADTDRLCQVFENLFRNAVDHAGGDVTVTVGDLEGGFYVEDDGPGIPEERREDVFASGYSTKDDGTGFGLSIVREIVEAHGWRIRVTEGAEGGARFEITGVEGVGEEGP